MPISSRLKDAIIKTESARYYDFGGAANDPDSPDFMCASYTAQMPDVSFVRDVYGGTKTMRAAARDYLPQGPTEQDDEYDARLNRATLFPAMQRTVHGLAGMIFRKDPVFEDGVSEALWDHAQNIDLAGRSLASFARDSALDALVDGHSWILVEYPRVSGENAPASRAEERIRGLRPYWVSIPKTDAINWRYEIMDGRPVLTMFVYRAARTVADGAFGTSYVDTIRVLTPGAFAEYEFVSDKNKGQWMLVDEGQTSLGYIPVVPVYANRTGAFESVPPLMDLAYENVDHYQVRSDHRFALKFAGSPMPVISGASLSGIEWGANRALFLEDSGASATLLEASGNSLAASAQELRDIEGRMAALGLQMLVRESRAAETAQAKAIDKADSDSMLAVMAGQIEDALNEALAIHADYIGEEQMYLSVNKDYRNQEIEPAMLLALLAQVEAGRLPLTEMWAIMQRGEILTDQFDAEVALANLEVPEPRLLG